MKKNIQLLSFCLALIVLFGCSKEEDLVVSIPEPDPDPIEVLNPTLNLIYPIANDVVEYCCFDIEWESDPEVMDFRFVLSTDMAFDSILVDSLGLSNSLPMDLNLTSGKRYYWKVSSLSLDLEETSEFSVVDYIDKFSGVFSAQFHEEAWYVGMGTTLDTTYFKDVIISKSTKEGHISFNYGSQFDYKLKETPVGKSGALYFWDDVEDHPRFSRGGNLHLALDSLSFVSATDANGGGHRLTINAKLD